MELFERAADGEIGSILILAIIGLFLLRFILKLLKFVIVQFPAIAGGLIFGFVFAAEDGVDVDLVAGHPEMWDQLIPYVVPALAVAFVIWNIILSVIKAIFRSIFKRPEGASQQMETATSRENRQNERSRRSAADDGVVTESEKSAMQTRKRHMKEYENRNKRIHQHDLSHRDKNLNKPIVQRRRKANQTISRRVGA